LKITHILVAIAFFVIIVFPQHFLVAEEPPSLTMESTESQVMATAEEMTETFRDLLLGMSKIFMDRYSDVTDEKALLAMFELCNVLDTTVEHGWKSAKIAQLNGNVKNLINNENSTSLSSAEQEIIKSIKAGKFMELRREGEEYVVGVSLLNLAETSQDILNACVKCHNSILNDRLNKTTGLWTERTIVALDDIEALVIFRFSVSS